MWLGDGDLGMQYMDFNGLGVTPWMQPRFDASLLGLQPEVYQEFTAAALQEVRAVDPQNPLSSAIMHFQQPQNTNSSTLQANQVRQQPQPQSEFTALQPMQANQVHTESQLPQQQLQHCHSLGDKQQHMQSPQSHQQGMHLQLQQHQHIQQHRHHQAGQQQLHSRQEIPNVLSSLSATQSQSTPVNTTAPLFHPNFPDTNIIPMSASALLPLHSLLGSYSHEEPSNLSFLGKNYLLNSGARPSKRMAIESSGTHCIPSQVEHLCSPQTHISQLQHSVSFSERGCTLDQEGSTDPQSPLVFGVNMDSPSLLGQRGMEDEIGATAVPFPFTNFLGTMGTKLPLNQAFMGSGCLEESGFQQSADNPGQENRQNGIFVKVYKSGSFGRSLDISKFNSYPELRKELGRLFGLEGQLDDPIRSGWQLVFVDRENDVLLIGDDPWQEFVNNVWCIKILSPQDVQQMAHEGVDLLSSDPAKRLSSGSYGDIVSRANSTNLSNGIASVAGLLDY